MSKLNIHTILKNNNITYVVVLLLSFFVYGNTLKNDYALDSVPIVEQNPEIKKGIKGIPDFFTQSFDEGLHGFSEKGLGYRPLSITTFAIEYSLMGEPNSKLSHLIQILIYALCIIVLFKVVQHIIRPSAFILVFITLLFLTHPVHSEVINDVKNRDELLVFLGGMSALLFMYKFYLSKKPRQLLLSLICFVFALLSKESAIIYLAIIPVTLYYFTDFEFKRVGLYIVPFIVLSVLIMGYNYFLSGYITFSDGLIIDFAGLSSYVDKSMNSLVAAESLTEKSASIINILGHHLKVILWPHPLVHSYRYAVIPLADFSSPFVWITLVVFLVAIVYVIKTLKNKSLIGYGIIIYLIGISLYSNTFSLAPDDMAERYLFLPSFGFLIVGGVLLERFIKVRSVKIGVLFFITLLFFGKTISRNTDWKNNFTLYSKDIQYIPNCAQAQLFLGMEYAKLAEKEMNKNTRLTLYNQAIEHKKKAVEILPEYARAQFSLGADYITLNKNKIGIQHLKNAAKYAPKSLDSFTPDIYNIMSVGYRKEKQFDKAIEASLTSIRLQPSNAVFYNTLASHYFEQQDLTTALKYVLKAHELDPNYLEAIKNLAVLYYNLGNMEYANYYKQLFESKK